MSIPYYRIKHRLLHDECFTFVRDGVSPEPQWLNFWSLKSLGPAALAGRWLWVARWIYHNKLGYTPLKWLCPLITGAALPYSEIWFPKGWFNANQTFVDEYFTIWGGEPPTHWADLSCGAESQASRCCFFKAGWNTLVYTQLHWSNLGRFVFKGSIFSNVSLVDKTTNSRETGKRLSGLSHWKGTTRGRLHVSVARWRSPRDFDDWSLRCHKVPRRCHSPTLCWISHGIYWWYHGIFHGIAYNLISCGYNDLSKLGAVTK